MKTIEIAVIGLHANRTGAAFCTNLLQRPSSYPALEKAPEVVQPERKFASRRARVRRIQSNWRQRIKFLDLGAENVRTGFNVKLDPFYLSDNRAVLPGEEKLAFESTSPVLPIVRARDHG